MNTTVVAGTAAGVALGTAASFYYDFATVLADATALEKKHKDETPVATFGVVLQSPTGKLVLSHFNVGPHNSYRGLLPSFGECHESTTCINTPDQFESKLAEFRVETDSFLAPLPLRAYAYRWSTRVFMDDDTDTIGSNKRKFAWTVALKRNNVSIEIGIYAVLIGAAALVAGITGVDK